MNDQKYVVILHKNNKTEQHSKPKIFSDAYAQKEKLNAIAMASGLNYRYRIIPHN